MKVYTHEDVLKLMNRIHVYEINRDLCMLKLTPIDMEEKLLEYWNGGINSTEEGGKSFDQYHNEHHEDNLVEIPTLPQQEISDEDINNAWEMFRIQNPNTVGGFQDQYASFCFAIKWYREQLKCKGSSTVHETPSHGSYADLEKLRRGRSKH
jgi:hypothetical protein